MVSIFAKLDSGFNNQRQYGKKWLMCLLVDDGAGSYITKNDQPPAPEFPQTLRTQLDDDGEMSMALHAGFWKNNNL